MTFEWIFGGDNYSYNIDKGALDVPGYRLMVYPQAGNLTDGLDPRLVRKDGVTTVL